MTITIFEYVLTNGAFVLNKYVIENVTKKTIVMYGSTGYAGYTRRLIIPDSWYKVRKNKNGYIGGGTIGDYEDPEYYGSIYAFLATPSEDEVYLKEVQAALKKYVNDNIMSMINYKEEKISELRNMIIV